MLDDKTHNGIKIGIYIEVISTVLNTNKVNFIANLQLKKVTYIRHKNFHKT